MKNKDKSKLIMVRLSTLKDPTWRFNHSGTRDYKTVILGGDKWYVKKFNKWKFYDAVSTNDHVLTVQTADQQRYANILLHIGVRMD